MAREMGQNQERIKNQVKNIMKQSDSIKEDSCDSDDDTSMDAAHIFSEMQDQD